MKKYAVFAHYDSECKIDNYVINYLKEIRKNCDVVVFVLDSFFVRKIKTTKKYGIIFVIKIFRYLCEFGQNFLFPKEIWRAFIMSEPGFL